MAARRDRQRHPPRHPPPAPRTGRNGAQRVRQPARLRRFSFPSFERPRQLPFSRDFPTMPLQRGEKSHMTKAFIVFAALAAGGPARADAAASGAPFSGFHAGAEAGGIEHHFYLTASRNGQQLSSRYYRASGIGAGLFAGYDVAVAPRVRLGAEAEATFGGATPTATFPDGTTF